MRISGDAEPTPLDPVQDLSRILAAMRAAVRDALLCHKRPGNPIAVWQDGGIPLIASGRRSPVW